LAWVARFEPGRARRARGPRRRARLRRAPWQPLAVLVGVAGALWVAAEYPSFRGGKGPLVTSANGTFGLCVRAQQQSCVIDGDTIRYGGMTIRLADIDAPETRSPSCPSEAALGRQATERLLELINAGPFEVVRTGLRDEDRYGRKLRTVERAGRSLGDVLVAEGLARPWDGARRSWCG
jgi:micrococcal nuclease